MRIEEIEDSVVTATATLKTAQAEVEAELLLESICVIRKVTIARDHPLEVTAEAGAALLVIVIIRMDIITMEEFSKDIMNKEVPTHQEVDPDLLFLNTTNKTVEVTQDHHLMLLPLLNHQREWNLEDRALNYTLKLKMSIREEKK